MKLKGKKIFILFLIIIILLPIYLDKFIFDNSYPSRVSNDGWAGFLGGYIGSIIGAIATIVAIKLDINHNNEIRQEDERQKKIDERNMLRPYLCIDRNSTIIGDAITKLSIKNVGFHAACDISIQSYSKEINEYRTLFSPHIVIDKSSVEEIKGRIDLSEFEHICFNFLDIKGNTYRQKIVVTYGSVGRGKLPIRLSTIEPELIETKEEREKRVN